MYNFFVFSRDFLNNKYHHYKNFLKIFFKISFLIYINHLKQEDVTTPSVFNIETSTSRDEIQNDQTKRYQDDKHDVMKGEKQDDVTHQPQLRNDGTFSEDIFLPYYNEGCAKKNKKTQCQSTVA